MKDRKINHHLKVCGVVELGVPAKRPNQDVGGFLPTTAKNISL